MKMGSLASASNAGDKVHNEEEDEEDSMVTTAGKESSEQVNIEDGKGDGDDGVKSEIYKGDQVKSEDFKVGEFEKGNTELKVKNEDEVKCEDGVKGDELKSEIQKVLRAMMVELDSRKLDQVKVEENVKTEDQLKKIDKDEEDETVDVEDEEEGNVNDSVNIAEMPTEGPQATEEEQKEESNEPESPSVAMTETEEKEDDNSDQCPLDATESSKISANVREEEVTDGQQDNQDDIVVDTITTSMSQNSKELQCEDVDEEVVEAMECITNHVSSENIPVSVATLPAFMECKDDDSVSIPVETTIEDEEPTSPCSPVPETGDSSPHSAIPAPGTGNSETGSPAPGTGARFPETGSPGTGDLVPETETEVGVSKSIVNVPETVAQVPVTLPVPVPPVEDPELTLLKKEMDRLKAALYWERSSKAELSSKLKKSQEELAIKTKNLNIAENKLWERSTAVASLAERDIQLKTLQESYNKLEKENGALQQKHDHLKNSLVDIGKEFYGIYETLQNHFKICSVNGPEMVPLTPHEALQRRIDDLTTSVHERYKFWNAEHRKMGEELGDTKKTMEELIEFLEIAEEKKPPPPAETVDRATSPIIPPKPSKAQKKKKKELKCDLCHNSFSNSTILKRHRKSCGDAVAGTSSSSNPATPAVDDSDSDDVAILENEDSPSPAVIDYSDDDTIASPTKSISPTIPPPPLSSPPIVLSKIALSFAPPSVPSSSPPKRKRSSATAVVQESTHLSSPITHTRDLTKRDLGYFCICGAEFLTKKRLDGHFSSQESELSEKPTSKKGRKLKENPSPPSSPPPSLPQPSSPPKKKKGDKPKKSEIVGHAVDSTKELTCTCGRDFINQYHLKTHIEREAKNTNTPTTKPPPPKVVANVTANTSSLEKGNKRASVDIVLDDVNETTDKTKKRVISEEPESLEEGSSLRSSKRLKKIQETTPAKDEAPTPSPRTRTRSPKKAKTEEVSTRSPRKSPKKVSKVQDLTPKTVVHEQDRSKSSRRGLLFCKCGLNFRSRRKLNIHLFCRKNDEQNNEKEKTGGQIGNGIGTFVCGSCGESFESNAERIKHRVIAHGHGLNT